MDNASKIKPVKMAAEERRKYILSMLEQYGSVTVSELSEHFGISEVSVRKLLISLEQDSLLQRTWGGAVRTARTTAELPYQVRESKYLQEKMAIARAAYDMINDGDSTAVRRPLNWLNCSATGLSAAFSSQPTRSTMQACCLGSRASV